VIQNESIINNHNKYH